MNFARKIFFELRIFLRKLLRNFPRNFRAFVLWVRKNPGKFPPNFPLNFPNFPAKNQKKFTDELLQEHREKTFAFVSGGHWWQSWKSSKTSFFLGKRHDNKILKGHILSLTNFIVIAQAPIKSDSKVKFWVGPKVTKSNSKKRLKFQGPLNGGVSDGGVSRSGLVLPFLSFFVLLGLSRGFSRFARGWSGDFPDLSFSSFSAY